MTATYGTMKEPAHDVGGSALVTTVPYLVPLSFDWDGEALLVATPGAG